MIHSEADRIPAPPATVCTPASPAGRRAVFWRYLAFILAAKVVLEMFCFVGIVRQYGEEDIFVSLALPSQEPGRTYWDSIAHFKPVTNWAEWKGDPSDMYPFRIAALYPNQYFMQAFGASEYSLSLWSAITGIGAVLLVSLIGRSLGGAEAGLFSGSVLALIPGHVIYSARVDTDMPQLFFMSLGVFFLVLALKAATNWKQWALAAASGLAFGFLYLAKLLPAFLSLPWALLMPFLLVALRDKETLLAPRSKLRQALSISLLLLGGFAVVFTVEDIAYHHLSGHWFLHWKIMKCNAVNMESWRCSKFATFAFIKLWLPVDGWRHMFEHAQMFYNSLSPEDNFFSVYAAPIHGWSAVIFLPALLVLPFLHISHRKLSLLVVLGFVFYYLYQEFFWFYPTIEGGMLNLTFVDKVHRFIFPCYLGIGLCVGLVLGAVSRFGRRCAGRWPRRIFQAAPVCLVLAFGAANYPGMKFFQHALHGSLQDLRNVCKDLRGIAQDGARVYIPAGMNPYYRVFQYPRHYEFKYFVDEPKDAVRNGWGVVGGFLGIGLSPEVFVEEYSDWLRPYYLGKAGPPPGWKLVHTRPTAAYDGIPPVRILKLPPADGETDP
jgi:hypothetical protein